MACQTGGPIVTVCGWQSATSRRFFIVFFFKQKTAYEMCAAAAVFDGCTFFSGYPITPSTEIMQFFDREIWKYGGTVLQAEDEIAGVGAVVGASFAGKKAMTATSGPGMSLKTEMLGLASIAELPLVCVNVQRGGPSTGMPTKSEQSGLFQAAVSAHGCCFAPVLTPHD